MSEAAPKKKRRVGIAMKAALLSVIEKKKFTDRIGWEAIATRHSVARDALKHAYKDWKDGGIDLGPPETLQEKHLDAQAQHDQMELLLKRYQALVADAFEKQLFKAEDAAEKGHKFDPKKSPLPVIMRELTALLAAREKVEAARERVTKELVRRNLEDSEPRAIPGREVAPAPAQIAAASEQEAALAALKAMGQPAQTVEVAAVVTPA